jgi:hypothetical protein
MCHFFELHNIGFWTFLFCFSLGVCWIRINPNVLFRDWNKTLMMNNFHFDIKLEKNRSWCKYAVQFAWAKSCHRDNAINFKYFNVVHIPLMSFFNSSQLVERIITTLQPLLFCLFFDWNRPKKLFFLPVFYVSGCFWKYFMTFRQSWGREN